MNTDPGYEQVRELAWRRPLTAEEQERLRGLLDKDPALRSDWEGEAALTHALQGMAEVPVPSNFNARVLAEVEREMAAASRKDSASTSRWHFWRRWLPRTAVAGAVVGLGIGFYAQETRQNHRERLVESVATVAEVSSLPSPEILKDFEAIRALSQTPPADEQLLTLLQ